MKLSAYARAVGISYFTAWRWFKAGRIRAYQAETGTVIVTEPLPETVRMPSSTKVAIGECQQQRIKAILMGKRNA